MRVAPFVDQEENEIEIDAVSFPRQLLVLISIHCFIVGPAEFSTATGCH